MLVVTGVASDDGSCDNYRIQTDKPIEDTCGKIKLKSILQGNKFPIYSLLHCTAKPTQSSTLSKRLAK